MVSPPRQSTGMKAGAIRRLHAHPPAGRLPSGQEHSPCRVMLTNQPNLTPRDSTRVQNVVHDKVCLGDCAPLPDHSPQRQSHRADNHNERSPRLPQGVQEGCEQERQGPHKDEHPQANSCAATPARDRQNPVLVVRRHGLPTVTKKPGEFPTPLSRRMIAGDASDADAPTAAR
jgi:hypothetical protein